MRRKTIKINRGLVGRDGGIVWGNITEHAVVFVDVKNNDQVIVFANDLPEEMRAKDVVKTADINKVPKEMKKLWRKRGDGVYVSGGHAFSINEDARPRVRFVGFSDPIEVDGDGDCMYTSFLRILNTANIGHVKSVQELRNALSDKVGTVLNADIGLLDEAIGATDIPSAVAYVRTMGNWGSRLDIRLFEQYMLSEHNMRVTVLVVSAETGKIINVAPDKNDMDMRYVVLRYISNQHYEPIMSTTASIFTYDGIRQFISPPIPLAPSSSPMPAPIASAPSPSAPSLMPIAAPSPSAPSAPRYQIASASAPRYQIASAPRYQIASTMPAPRYQIAAPHHEVTAAPIASAPHHEVTAAPSPMPAPRYQIASTMPAPRYQIASAPRYQIASAPPKKVQKVISFNADWGYDICAADFARDQW